MKFFLGLLTGFFLTIWYVAFDEKWSFDTNISVNIIIASAAIVATIIHYDASRKQRQDRVWEINKDNLLSLSKALSEIIVVTGKQAEFEFEKEQGIPTNDPKIDLSKTYQKFSKSLSESLSVFEPMLGEEIIISLNEYKNKDTNLEKGYENNHLTLFDLFEYKHHNQINLHKALSIYIKKLAGTKNT